MNNLLERYISYQPLCVPSRRWESLGGGRLICQSEFYLGAVGNVITTHDILYPELAKKKPTFIPGLPAPPPPPRTRKGSNFPLQTYGSRLNKVNAPIQFYSTNKVQMTPGNQPSVDKRTCVLIGTARGTLGLLVPLDEKMYKRLALLQELMSRTMVTAFALNPKDYRIAHRQFMQVRYPDVQTTTSLDQQTQHNMSASFVHNKQVILDGVLVQRFVFLPHVLQEQLASVLGVTAYLIRENLHEIDYISRFF
ncbi:hypothetical protein EON65_14745 [archaeon]|nr:MAG: hypothetical protein EON65_14745 [archaeon]